MTAATYRSRVIEVEAIQFTGSNIDDIHTWANGPDFDPNDDDQNEHANVVGDERGAEVWSVDGDRYEAWPGDWIIRHGTTFSVLPDDEFHASFEVPQ